jgi:hypothetical protein
VSPIVGAKVGTVIQPRIVDAQKKLILGDEFAMQCVSIVEVVLLPLKEIPDEQKPRDYQSRDGKLQF